MGKLSGSAGFLPALIDRTTARGIVELEDLECAFESEECSVILFHDVDGCLNEENGAFLGFAHQDLDHQSRSALAEFGRALDASPVEHFVLNTGRSWLASEYLLQEINSGKARYALLEHASELWDLQAGEMIDLRVLSRGIGAHHLAEAADDVAVVVELMRWFRLTGATALARAVGSDQPFELTADKRCNLTFSVPESVDGHRVLSELKNLIDNLAVDHSDLVYHFSAPDRFIDVMGRLDKGSGVELVAGLVGSQRSVAVGNGLNDLPMLDAADLAICPANAEPAVKRFCADNGRVSNRSYIGATFEWLEGATRDFA